MTMTFHEFVENKVFVELQAKVPLKLLDEINILFETNRWDGVLSGYCEHENRLCYFTCFDERLNHVRLMMDSDIEPTGWWRRYAILSLTDEQAQAALKRHEDFKTLVGTHCDYKDNKKQPGMLAPYESHKKFYEKYPMPTTKDDITTMQTKHDNHEVIGWFELSY